LKVIAVPGDRVHVVNGNLMTNDTRVEGFSAEFLDRVASSLSEQVVPAGHYYVMGERRENANISEYRGLHPASRLVLAQ
jgi:hypothetical protein